MPKKRNGVPATPTTSESFLNCDSDAFFELVPHEPDHHFVYGRGDKFHLKPCDSEKYEPTPFGFEPVGLIGVTPNGEVAACFLKWASLQAPMASAAAFLASSELAKQRRVENASVNAWLHALYSLPDLRDATTSALTA